MANHRQPGGPRPQAVAVLPLELDQILPAMFFDGLAVRGSEHLLPGKSRALAVIAHVSNSAAHETCRDLGVHPLVHLTAVDDWRFTPLPCRLHAAEPDFLGPAVIEGIFVVPQQLSLGRKEYRRVDVAGNIVP